MIKLLPNPFFITLLLLTLTVAANAAPVEPVRVTCIPSEVYDEIVIDGTAEEAYSEIQTTGIFNATGLEGENDFQAQFRLCNNPYYLFIYAEITDDVNHSYEWGVGNPWEFDNFEIFLQLDTNTVTTSYSGSTIQLRICRGLDSVETTGRAARSDYQYYMEANAAGGWISEVAVPWTAVLLTGSLPSDMDDYFDTVIGFDFNAADSDNSDGDAAVGNRDVQSAWDMDDPDDPDDRTEDLAWNNTSVFGYITLVHCSMDIWPSDALEDTPQDNAIRIYHDPNEEKIRFINSTDLSQVTIFNIQGSIVLNATCRPGQELDISSLKSGIYVALFDGKESLKFVKQ